MTKQTPEKAFKALANEYAEVVHQRNELLQALKHAAYWLLERDDWYSIQFHDTKQQVEERIRTAIAKATGSESVRLRVE